jgi:hypothetical protein
VNSTQVAKKLRARRDRPGPEPLPPDPFDPDVVRVKALARAARPVSQHGTVVSRTQRWPPQPRSQAMPSRPN